MDPAAHPDDIFAPETRFAEELNARLSRSSWKDVVVFIHGYNTRFENPSMLAAGFWHHMGYRGVPVAFSWPSEQRLVKYISDVKTAEYAASAFRLLLEFLADRTEAERIHIVAYSAGTKLATIALHQLGLKSWAEGKPEALDRNRLGRVVFVAGDVERQLFALTMMDGMGKVFEGMTIYMSETDQALKASRQIHGRERTGQTWTAGSVPVQAEGFLRDRSTGIAYIDVTAAENARAGQGHSYFYLSPWVSSDITLFLLTGLPPERRGLAYRQDAAYWTFPEDYPDRLDSLLRRESFP